VLTTELAPVAYLLRDIDARGLRWLWPHKEMPRLWRTN
jgi:hypothetical protein